MDPKARSAMRQRSSDPFLSAASIINKAWIARVNTRIRRENGSAVPLVLFIIKGSDEDYRTCRGSQRCEPH